MKRSMRKFFLLYLLALAAPALAQDVASKVESATVYQNGATVSRGASVKLAAGETSLTFPGLPQGISIDRFQFEVVGGDASVGQVRFEYRETSQAYDGQVRELQSQIDAQSIVVKSIEDDAATAKLKLKFLDGVAQGYAKEAWVGSAQGQANVESWRSALVVLADGAGEARQTLRETVPKQREAQRELSRLERSMQQLRGTNLRELAVTAVVNSDSARSIQVKLHYFVENARWHPHYVARLDSDAQSLQIVQQAQVTQQTDEDWRSIKLELSTSKPSGELQPPELGSEFVDIEREQIERMSLSKSRSPQASAALDMVVEEVVVTAGYATQIEVSAYTVNFSVPGNVSVLNDADEAQTFDLATHAFEPELVTRLVPSRSGEAFLTAHFTQDSELPLYGSSMAIYVDGVFVGESSMPTAMPGDDVTIPMGQDRRVELVVTDQGGKRGEGGFIGRRAEELTSLLYEVVNRRGSATVVEVVDRYPVAANEEVEVEIPDEATEPTEKDLDDQPGVIVWRKTLEANETWQIKHQYEVSYPADKRISRRG